MATLRSYSVLSSRQTAAAYLAALIDGEGCIGTYKWRGKSGARIHRRVMVISVTDPEIIDAAAGCLALLGVRATRFVRPPTGKGKRPVHGIQVTTRDGLAALLGLPLQHVGKRTRLREAAASFAPDICTYCGVARDQRTPGCTRCIDRHKYRRRREREGLPGKPAAPAQHRGRPPRRT